MSVNKCLLTSALLVGLVVCQSAGAAPRPPKYSADVPEGISTPDEVETKLLGQLNFTDGFPRMKPPRESTIFSTRPAPLNCF